MIGYLIEQELRARLGGRQIATLLTQIEVDPADPAFREPTKPIGPVYQQAEADRLAAAFRWTLRAERGGLRRVVPSPEPRRIVELATIRLLADAHVLVICAGGGGIPVVSDAAGRLHGVPAVIDKDLASALLAEELRADGLLLLTDVAAVYEGWEGASPRAIRATAPEALRRMGFAAGSMDPKVEAACRFVERTGGFAAIGALADGAAMLTGDAGTRIQAGIGAIAYWDA
jgi:carbamate kinase